MQVCRRLNCADGLATVGWWMTARGSLEWQSTRLVAMRPAWWIVRRAFCCLGFRSLYRSDVRCPFNSTVNLPHDLLYLHWSGFIVACEWCETNVERVQRGYIFVKTEKNSVEICSSVVFMVALWYRAGHYIFALWFLSSIFYLSFFIPRLISAVADWMSTILWHVVWP